MGIELVSILPSPNALPFGDSQWGVALLLVVWKAVGRKLPTPLVWGRVTSPVLGHRLHSVPWSLLALADLSQEGAEGTISGATSGQVFALRLFQEVLLSSLLPVPSLL